MRIIDKIKIVESYFKIIESLLFFMTIGYLLSTIYYALNPDYQIETSLYMLGVSGLSFILYKWTKSVLTEEKAHEAVMEYEKKTNLSNNGGNE